MGDFKKWEGDPCNVEYDFEMVGGRVGGGVGGRGDTSLRIMLMKK